MFGWSSSGSSPSGLPVEGSCRSSPCCRMDWSAAVGAGADLEAARNRPPRAVPGRSWRTSRRMPRQARNPCSGCGLLCRIRRGQHCRPRARWQPPRGPIRSIVHSACRRCAPWHMLRQRRVPPTRPATHCTATRSPLWNSSMVRAVSARLDLLAQQPMAAPSSNVLRHSLGRHRSPSRPDERTDRSPAQRSGNATPLRGGRLQIGTADITSELMADMTSECLADLPRSASSLSCHGLATRTACRSAGRRDLVRITL